MFDLNLWAMTSHDGDSRHLIKARSRLTAVMMPLKSIFILVPSSAMKTEVTSTKSVIMHGHISNLMVSVARHQHAADW